MDPLGEGDPRWVGRYRVQAQLGAGGMGRVYLAFSPGGRAVAVKVIHPELARDPAFLARFRQEVTAARKVSGVYTAPVIDASGDDEDPPWLATAFVPGPSLADAVAERGPLPPESLWRLAAGLAEALAVIHGHGLVHRDLKPPPAIPARFPHRPRCRPRRRPGRAAPRADHASPRRWPPGSACWPSPP